jgi:hypothetical protein
MSVHEPQDPLVLTDPKIVALCLAIGGYLLAVKRLSNGRLEFHVAGVRADFHERVLNDEVQVSAKRFIGEMEHVMALIAQRRRPQ